MSFIGVTGVVAQQGNQAAALPDEPYLATTSTNTFTNAVVTQAFEDNSLMSGIHYQAGGDFHNPTTNVITTQLDITELNNWTNSSQMHIVVGAYLHGDASYSYAISSLTTDIEPNEMLVSVGGTSHDGADATLGSQTWGIGKYVKLESQGGRGGLTWGTAGEYIQFQVIGTADSTATDTLTVKMVWTAGDAGD